VHHVVEMCYGRQGHFALQFYFFFIILKDIEEKKRKKIKNGIKEYIKLFEKY